MKIVVITIGNQKSRKDKKDADPNMELAKETLYKMW